MPTREIALAHVTGYDVDEGVARRRLEALYQSLHTGAPYPAIHGSGNLTQQVESAWRLGACVYFFVGWLCPAFGPIGLVVTSDADRDHVKRFGSEACQATAMDTGGLFHGKGAFKTLETLDSTAREELFLRHTFVGDVWRDQFVEEIRQHYGGRAEDYIAGIAPTGFVGSRARLAPTARGPHEESRPWRWEVRLREPAVALADSLIAIVLTDQAAELLLFDYGFDVEAWADSRIAPVRVVVQPSSSPGGLVPLHRSVLEIMRGTVQ